MILAKTIKGWTLGAHFEGRNATHQMKKLTLDDLKAFRDRLYLDIPDSALEATRTSRRTTTPAATTSEIQYMLERRDDPRRLRAVAADHGGAAAASRRTESFDDDASAARASRRSPPRWPSSGCSRT